MDNKLDIAWKKIGQGVFEQNWYEFVFGYILLVDEISKEGKFGNSRFGNASAYHQIRENLANFLTDRYPDIIIFEDSTILTYFHKTAV